LHTNRPKGPQKTDEAAQSIIGATERRQGEATERTQEEVVMAGLSPAHRREQASWN